MASSSLQLQIWQARILITPYIFWLIYKETLWSGQHLREFQIRKFRTLTFVSKLFQNVSLIKNLNHPDSQFRNNFSRFFTKRKDSIISDRQTERERETESLLINLYQEILLGEWNFIWASVVRALSTGQCRWRDRHRSLQSAEGHHQHKRDWWGRQWVSAFVLSGLVWLSGFKTFQGFYISFL